ncbi:hypothetical protein ES708_14622 [subsurface metagenome]
MTIDKDLELLKEARLSLSQHHFNDHADAVSRSMKALEHCKTCPYFEYQATDELPPGETED